MLTVFWAKQPVKLEVTTQLYIHNPKLLLSCIAIARIYYWAV